MRMEIRVWSMVTKMRLESGGYRLRVLRHTMTRGGVVNQQQQQQQPRMKRLRDTVDDGDDSLWGRAEFAWIPLTAAAMMMILWHSSSGRPSAGRPIRTASTAFTPAASRPGSCERTKSVDPSTPANIRVRVVDNPFCCCQPKRRTPQNVWMRRSRAPSTRCALEVRNGTVDKEERQNGRIVRPLFQNRALKEHDK